MDLDELAETLADLQSRYDEWSRPINEHLQANMMRVNQDGYAWDDLMRENDQVKERQLAAYDPDPPLYIVLDDLCPAYLDATDDWRMHVRTIVAAQSGLPDRVRAYAQKIASRINSAEDEESLRVALAAMSIEDAATDYRDTLSALADIYVRAERAGIDARRSFVDASRLSSTEVPAGGSTPLADVLREFHGYAILQERRGD